MKTAYPHIETRNGFLHVREIKSSNMTAGGIALPESSIQGTGMYEVLQASHKDELNAGDVVVLRHTPSIHLKDGTKLVESEFVAGILSPDIAESPQP